MLLLLLKCHSKGLPGRFNCTNQDAWGNNTYCLHLSHCLCRLSKIPSQMEMPTCGCKKSGGNTYCASQKVLIQSKNQSYPSTFHRTKLENEKCCFTRCSHFCYAETLRGCDQCTAVHQATMNCQILLHNCSETRKKCFMKFHFFLFSVVGCRPGCGRLKNKASGRRRVIFG